MSFLRSEDILPKFENGVVIFTSGHRLSYDDSGNGETGIWVVKPERLEMMDKVIIYLREDNSTINRILVGTYAGYRPSEYPTRFNIRFTNLNEVGTTTANWHEFGKGGSNPIRFVIGTGKQSGMR